MPVRLPILPLLHRAGGVGLVDLRYVLGQPEGNHADEGAGGLASAGLGTREAGERTASLYATVACLHTITERHRILAFPAHRVVGNVEPRAALVLDRVTLALIREMARVAVPITDIRMTDRLRPLNAHRDRHERRHVAPQVVVAVVPLGATDPRLRAFHR